MVGPKKYNFWPKIHMIKGNYCFLGPTIEEFPQPNWRDTYILYILGKYFLKFLIDYQTEFGSSLSFREVPNSEKYIIKLWLKLIWVINGWCHQFGFSDSLSSKVFRRHRWQTQLHYVGWVKTKTNRTQTDIITH